MGDDCLVELLDHARQNGKPTWRGAVRSVSGEDIVVGALHPLLYWRVDSLLHVRAIEVDGCSCGCVIERARKPENIPQKRACRCDLIDVKARIDEQFGVEDSIPQVALARGVVGHWRIWKGPSGRIYKVFVQEGSVPAGVGLLVEEVHEGCVERKEGCPVVDIGNSGN